MTDEIELIGLQMLRVLPRSWVYDVMFWAQSREPYRLYLIMWRDAESEEERSEIVADLQVLLDDREPNPDRSVIRSHADLDAKVARRRALKAHLRAMVEAKGGVSEVARKADIPQPSLSRLLNSGAEPRMATMKKLAEAMRVSVSKLYPDARREDGDAEVFEFGNYHPRAPDTQPITIQHVSRRGGR